MNTPSPALLRKALKIVDEIEKLDQQIYRILAQVEEKKETKAEIASSTMPEEALAIPLSLPKKEEGKNPVPKETIVPALVTPHHEQQSLLIDDTGVEPLSVIEPKRSEHPEEISEKQCGEQDQSCCLF